VEGTAAGLVWLTAFFREVAAFGAVAPMVVAPFHA
jgi:hypothetical protein